MGTRILIIRNIKSDEAADEDNMIVFKNVEFARVIYRFQYLDDLF